MATSFITKDDVHGFWIKDSLIQVICWGMVNVIDNSADILPDWMDDEFRDYFFNTSQGLFVGFSNLSLDEYIVSKERAVQFTEIITKTKGFFLRKGDYISIDDLNDFQKVKETKRVWVLPLETARVIKILTYLEDVVHP